MRMKGPQREVGLQWEERAGFARFAETAVGEAWYLVKLNLLFLAGCMPVATIPMALTAAFRVTSILAGGGRPPLWRAFSGAFLGEWKSALPFGWAFLLLAGVAGYGVYAYGAMAGENALALLPLAFAVLILAAVTAAGTYFLSMLALCELSARQMLRNALILVAADGKRAFAAFFALLACFGVPAFFFPVALPLSLLLLPALGLLGASFALYPGLRRCMRAEGE